MGILAQLDELVGRTIEEAKNMEKYANYDFRIIEQDGKALQYKMENNPNRINVATENGIIREVVGIF